MNKHLIMHEEHLMNPSQSSWSGARITLN